MRRRLFLQFPLVVSSLTAAVQAAAAQGSTTQEQPKPGKGFKVAAGESHQQEELLIMGGRFDCLVSGKDTNGSLLIYDTRREEKGGPALHFHYNQDEWFYVMKGEFIFRVGEETFNLKPGDSAFAPRKIAHAFAKTSEGEAQMMVLFQPAGMMEDFFLEMSKTGKGILKDEQVMRKLWQTHGMEIVGPPLKF